ncbi:hypothetical protein ABVT39_000350 [Epinephelus coioides]
MESLQRREVLNTISYLFSSWSSQGGEGIGLDLSRLFQYTVDRDSWLGEELLTLSPGFGLKVNVAFALLFTHFGLAPSNIHESSSGRCGGGAEEASLDVAVVAASSVWRSRDYPLSWGQAGGVRIRCNHGADTELWDSGVQIRRVDRRTGVYGNHGVEERFFISDPVEVENAPLHNMSRWKILKKHYYLAKRQNQKSGSDPATFKFFETLDEMLGHHPLATAASSGVDIGFSNAAEPPQGDDLYPDMDDDAEEDLSRASTPAPAEATEDSAASANIDSLPASAEGIPTHASCERPSQESTTQDRRRRRRLNNTLSRQQDFLERFQEAQNTWMERQLRESFERERQLLTEVMQQSSRSMESLLRPLLGGMRGPYIPPSFQPTFPYANPNNMHYEVSPSYYPAPDTSQQGRGGAMEDNSENSFFEL